MNTRTFKSMVIRKGFKFDETEDMLIAFKKQNRKYVSAKFQKSKLNKITDKDLLDALYMMEVELNENI